MKKVLFVCVLLLASILRLWQIGHVPPSLNADEVAIGYNAYSLLKTGRDEYGKVAPLRFQSFDDYKLPVYVYATIPSISLFGLNDVSIRLPSAIFGVATVFVVYFLALELIGIQSVALGTSFLLSISPWHLQFSRSAYEANVALFFAVTGVLLLLRGLKRPSIFIFAFLSLGLSMWSYHSSQIFIPLIIAGFAFVYRRELKKMLPLFVTGVVVLVVLVSPIVYQAISPQGFVRAKGVSALDNPNLLSRSVRWQSEDATQGFPLGFMVHNRRLNSLSVLVSGYFAHFDLNFWFMEKAQGKYRVPGMGLLYLWELPFLFYGMYMLAQAKKKEKYIVFLWFLAAPVAASPTQQIPHAVRTLIFLPSFQLFTAYGIWETGRYVLRKSQIHKIFQMGLVVAVLGSFFVYLHQYYIHMPIDFGTEWQYGHEQIVREVQKMSDNYDTVIVSTSLDQPYIFFLYYLRYDPRLYLAKGGTVSGKFDEERNAFGKYEFHSYMKSGERARDGVLYVGMPTERLSGTYKIGDVKDREGNILYVLYDARPLKNY